MDHDKTSVAESNAAPAPEPSAEPEVEGHYISQFAAEQEAVLRQHQLIGSAERAHHHPDPAESTGIVDRIRRRFDR